MQKYKILPIVNQLYKKLTIFFNEERMCKLILYIQTP